MKYRTRVAVCETFHIKAEHMSEGALGQWPSWAKVDVRWDLSSGTQKLFLADTPQRLREGNTLLKTPKGVVIQVTPEILTALFIPMEHVWSVSQAGHPWLTGWKCRRCKREKALQDGEDPNEDSDPPCQPITEASGTTASPSETTPGSPASDKPE